MFVIALAKKLIVIGLTQGVGFRPFIYRLAKKNNLRGYVRNRGGSEVEIFLEGNHENINSFIAGLKEERPPPAEIEEIIITSAEPKGMDEFQILPSEDDAEIYSQIPPDFAICEHCLEDIENPQSRFFEYPFHSCAWCGPRFTIIERIPYDRENTSMSDFPLCEHCESEYKDKDNIRRFHAQGISCPTCGPKLWLVDRFGNVIDDKDPLKTAARLIDEGSIVALKGIGGFHIAALATDDEVVLELRRRKNRPQKPFALMALDIEIASKIVEIDEKAAKLLMSPARPIVLLPKRENSSISEYVAPGLDKYGVMIAYSGIHYILLKATRDRFLIMTSGNHHEKPIVRTNDEAIKKLSAIVDYIVLHNRRIVNRADDSVLRFTNGKPVFLRRSRGYAPRWLRVPMKSPRPAIAFGADLQNAGAVAFDDKVILTQFVGDLDELENLLFLEEALNFLVRSYNLDPSKGIIVADKHPRYASRRLAEEWAKRSSSEIVYLQHHRAHILSVVAEKGLDPTDKIVGIAIDGVGYGDDGNVWGGEVFYGEIMNLNRVGHLSYSPMPSGDLATRYPPRMLVGILSTFMSDYEIAEFFRKNGLISKFKSPRELEVMIQLSRKEKIRTSSLGRVLDAVSSLLNICSERTYEGEPAMKLEAFSREGSILDEIDVKVIRSSNEWVVDVSNLFESIVSGDFKPKDIAKTTQYLLGFGLGSIASKYTSSANVQAIFVSGGAAVNDYVIQGIIDGANGVDVVINSWVPPGDGGLALGQAYFAMALMRK